MDKIDKILYSRVLFTSHHIVGVILITLLFKYMPYHVPPENASVLFYLIAVRASPNIIGS